LYCQKQLIDPQIGRDILAGASFGLAVLLLDQAASAIAKDLVASGPCVFIS